MKKVLQITCYYYPHFGGIEQVTRDVANALKGEPFEQKIICFNEDASDGLFTNHRGQTVTETVDGVEVIRCGSICKVSSQSLSFSFAIQLKRLMNEFCPDIVILHYPNPFTTHFLLKYKSRPFKLYVYWHLDITKQKILKHLFHNQNIDLIKRADKIVGATAKHVNESEFTEHFDNKKAILPYAIDEKRLMISEAEIKEAERIKEKYAGKILCFFIGRHVPYKGLEYLIDASKYVNDNVHFLIAGVGELTEQLKQKAAGDNKIEFIGRIDDAEWRANLKACDIFCFPSITRNEGFGLALAEAMYYGKPAVTFTIPGSGVNFVCLDGVTGIECPNRDSRAYAEAINKLAESKELREQYGASGRQRVLDNFTAARFKKNLLAVLDAVNVK